MTSSTRYRQDSPRDEHGLGVVCSSLIAYGLSLTALCCPMPSNPVAGMMPVLGKAWRLLACTPFHYSLIKI